MSSNSIIPIEELKKDITLKANLCGNSLEFKTTWGLFSPEAIDAGTELLLNTLKKTDQGQTSTDLKKFSINKTLDILDLGCGYGPIGIALGKIATSGSIHLIDKDFVAVEYAEKNAKLNGIENSKCYLSNGFSAVPKDARFDLIISNLPAKISKEFFWILFAEANEHLKPGGQFLVVTIAGLEFFIKKNFEKIFGNYELLKNSSGYFVAKTVKGEQI